MHADERTHDHSLCFECSRPGPGASAKPRVRNFGRLGYNDANPLGTPIEHLGPRNNNLNAQVFAYTRRYQMARPTSQSRAIVQRTDDKAATAITMSGQSDL